MDVVTTISRLPSIGTPTGTAIATRIVAAAQAASPVKVSANAGVQIALPQLPALQRQLNTRMELEVDQPTGRVIGMVIDASTGAVVDQIPTEAMMRLLERTREIVGALLDKTA